MVDELETDLQLLWDTFSSLTTNRTFVGHQLDQLLRTTTSPQPFKLVGSTSPGGVHSTSTGRVNSGRLHLYNVFGLTHPQPTVSQFNQPRLCLHTGYDMDHGLLPHTWTWFSFVIPAISLKLPNIWSMLPLIGSHHWYVMWWYVISMWYTCLTCPYDDFGQHFLLLARSTLSLSAFHSVLIPFGYTIWNCGGVLDIYVDTLRYLDISFFSSPHLPWCL